MNVVPPLAVALPLLGLAMILGLALPRPAPRRPPSTGSRPDPFVQQQPWNGVARSDRLRRPGRHLRAQMGACARAIRRRLTTAGRQRRVDAALPDAVELLVLAVHAGSSPAQALLDVRASVGPALRPAFDALAHRMQRGSRLADAIGVLPDQLGPRARGLADAIAAADRYGAPLGPVLDALAIEARDDRRRLGESRARTLSVKLTFPLVVCTLPAFVLLAVVPPVLGALDGLPTSTLRP